LRSAPEWAGVIAFDGFRQKTFLINPPWDLNLNEPRAWAEEHDGKTCEWLQREGIHCSLDVTAKAVQNIARENTFHPVKDYLCRLEWDGEARVNKWLETYLGVKPKPDAPCDGEGSRVSPHRHYVMAVGRCWLISAIARVMQPGCQADYMLVLEGPQGKKKSTALRILAAPWFTDELAEPGSKDAAIQLQGKWIVEMSELDAIRKSDISTVKAFLTRRSDDFRPPYGRISKDFPRQCVFAGTTNGDDYLKDHTGNRRVWPVACGCIDVESLRRDRDQLWAEAFELYKNGSVWHLVEDAVNNAAEAEQAERFDSDVWEPNITTFVDDMGGDVSIDEVLHHLGIDIGKRTQRDKNRIAAVLKGSLGLEHYQKRLGGKSPWRYRRRL
jgi:putative DNA primase/helicase